jgi:parallel beta-helix repeat protein
MIMNGKRSLAIAALLMTVVFAGMMNMGSDHAAATAVSGQQSGTWTLANSPYYVEGNVYIEDGQTLTIEAGVEVYVNGTYEILVNGTLLADGTEANPILITSNQSVPSTGDWLGIKINRVLIPLVNGQADFLYTNISYAEVGINITASNNPSTVTNCTFYMNENGVSLHGVGSMMAWSPSQNNVIQNSTFIDNGNGTYIKVAVNNDIVNNVYSGNNYGIATFDLDSPDFIDHMMAPSSTDLYIADNRLDNQTRTGLNIIGNFFIGGPTNNIYSNNTFKDNNNTVQLVAGSYDEFSLNRMINNGNGSIILFCNNDTIFSNNIGGVPNSAGMALMGCTDNEVYGNTLTNNGLGLMAMGLGGFAPSARNFIGNNTVLFNGNGIIMANSQYDTLYNNTVNFSFMDNMILQNANYTKVLNNNISFSSNGMGLSMQMANEAIIMDNVIISNQLTNMFILGVFDSVVEHNDALLSVSDVGIMAQDSMNVTIIDNNALANDRANVGFINVTDSMIRNNNASASPGGHGIFVMNSAWNDVFDNWGFGNSEMGLLLVGADNITVDNNTYRFSGMAGIGLMDTMDSMVTNSFTTESFIGVYSESSSANTVMDHNASMTVGGVYLNNSADFTLDNVDVYNDITNMTWGMYLFNTSDSRIFNSQLSGNGASGLAMTQSSFNTVMGNTITMNNNGTVVNDSSMNNDFMQNTVSSNNFLGYLFENMADSNTVANDDILTNLVGTRVRSSADVLFVNCTISSISNDFEMMDDGHATALNVSFDKAATFYNEPLSDLTVQWFEHAQVLDSTMGPLSGADVFVNDFLGTLVYDSTVQGTSTDLFGYLRWIVVSEYLENQGGQAMYTPHNSTANWMGKTGYNVTSVDMSMDVIIVIDTQAPNIVTAQAAPTPQSVNSFVNVTADVTDDIGVISVDVNITDPMSGPVGNFSMAYDPISGWYFYNNTYGMLGFYSFTVWAFDANGNFDSFSGSFEIVDNIPPTVTDLTESPDPQEVMGFVNVTANATDNYDPTPELWINIAGVGNFSMSYDPISGKYYFEASYATTGTYTYTIWANDASGNFASDSGSFLIQDTGLPVISDLTETPDPQEVGGNVNVTANITDIAGIAEVWINITGEGNFTMNPGAGILYFYDATYSATGTYTYMIWARDSSGNWNNASSSFAVQDTTNPVADAGNDATIDVGDSVDFDGSGSSDNSGTIDDYTWEITLNGSLVATLSGVSPSHTFNEAGTYTVTLTVTDPSGNTDTDTMTVTVEDTTEPPPPPDGDGDFLSDYWWLILIIVIVIVVILLLVMLLGRKKKPEEEMPPTAPEEGELPPPPPEDEMALEEPSEPPAPEEIKSPAPEEPEDLPPPPDEPDRELPPPP